MAWGLEEKDIFTRCSELPDTHDASCPSQLIVCTLSPTHEDVVDPGGRSHWRLRILTPATDADVDWLRQLIEHGLKSDQQDHWPTQLCALHIRYSVADPGQSWPAPLGGGDEQDRRRYWAPPSQLALHGDHGDHVVQPPSTSGAVTTSKRRTLLRKTRSSTRSLF